MFGHGYTGRGVIQITGRRPYAGVMPPYKAVIKGNFEIMESAVVGRDTWYKIQVVPQVSEWIKQQDKNSWHEFRTGNNYKVLDTFNVHEKLYTMLILNWSET